MQQLTAACIDACFQNSRCTLTTTTACMHAGFLKSRCMAEFSLPVVYQKPAVIYLFTAGCYNEPAVIILITVGWLFKPAVLRLSSINMGSVPFV